MTTTITDLRDEFDSALAFADENATAYPKAFWLEVSNWYERGIYKLDRSSQKRRSPYLRARDLRDAAWYLEQIKLAIAGQSPYIEKGNPR